MSSSFTDFYLDEAIPGHLFLKPSIFVGKSYQRIFSSIEETGCEATVEIVTRIVLFVILPVIAIISAIFIPIGLICKGLGNLFCPPLPKEKNPVVVQARVSLKTKPWNPAEPITRSNNLISNSPPVQKPEEEQPEPSHILLQQIQEANKILDLIEQKLNKILFKNIDIEQIDQAKTLLRDQKISLLLCEVPQKNNPKDPLCPFSERYSVLMRRIDSLEYHYHFYSQTLTEEGEFKVDDNGDCLFASFIKHAEWSNPKCSSLDAAAIQEEREQTIQWIENHYASDKELQRHLVGSLAEHYHSKIEKLQDEEQDLRQLINNPDPEVSDMKDDAELRLQEIPNEIELLYKEIIPQITEAFGKAHSKVIKFECVQEIVTTYYLVEMKQKGVHGGAAELYALSCRHQVCAKVHKKDGNIIGKDPYEIMNPKFETKEKPVRHFTHTRNHYNPYFPPTV